MTGLLTAALRWNLRRRCYAYVWHRGTADDGRTEYAADVCHRWRWHRGKHRA